MRRGSGMNFETAMEALMNGKKIRKKNDIAWYTKDTVLELSLKTIYNEFVNYNEWIISE
jgi:hypothetical protein